MAAARDRLRTTRRTIGRDQGAFIALVALAAVLCVTIYLWDAVTATALLMPLLFAVVLLSPRRLPTFILLVLAMLLVETVAEFRAGDVPTRRWVALILLLITTAFTFIATGSRGEDGGDQLSR